MFKEEAIWLGEYIYDSKSDDFFPLLNLGSSTEEFRALTQPWIDSYVFAPARSRGLPVIHMDLKDAIGVDLTGDISSPEMQSALRIKAIKSVLCSNLLEHVIDREAICAGIENILRPGGYIVVTCPYQYPFHPDPIDTLYRPRPDELAALFPNSSLVQSSILDCGTLFQSLIQNPKLLLWTAVRLCLPLYKPAFWWQLARFQLWMFRTFRVSCVVLQKKNGRVMGRARGLP